MNSEMIAHGQRDSFNNRTSRSGMNRANPRQSSLALRIALALAVCWLTAQHSEASNTETQSKPVMQAQTAMPPIQQSNRPQRIPAIYTKAFIPKGYDTNDRVEFVLTADLSTTCWRPADVVVDIDEEQKLVTLGPAAYEYPGLLCGTLMTEYKQVVNLGILPSSGQYRVVQKTDGALLGALDIRSARTDAPDDLPYAPIDQAFIYQAGADAHVVLSGEFSLSCQEIDRVEYDVQPDVVVVLPITKRRAGEPCRPGKFQFRERKLITGLQPNRYLLHVRSANGASVNSLFTIDAANSANPVPSRMRR